MARNFSKLLDELDAIPHPITGGYDPIRRRNVDRTSTAGKVVRARSTLAKSLPDLMLKAGIDTTKLKPFAGSKKPAKTEPVERVEPREHAALRVARLLGEMKRNAQGANLNGPVSEKQLLACEALSRAGELSQDEVADVEKAMKDGRALPLYIIKKLGSGNT